MYDQISRVSNLNIITSGRYFITQWGYKKKLALDIAKKLDLNKADHVLDLGCNIGIYHKYLHHKVSSLLGIDASANVIEKAKLQNRFSNVEYQFLDLTKEWPNFSRQYSKVLVYSVVHFLDSTEQLDALIRRINLVLAPGGKILFGEVRTSEKYNDFLEKQRTKTSKTMRDYVFQLNKFFQHAYLGKIEGFPCTRYESQKFIKICEDNGFQVDEIDQENFHPFYNTCSDFVLTKTNSN